MKPVGVVRTVDDLGRFVIPKDIRDRLGIVSGTELEIFMTDTGIFLRPFKGRRVPPPSPTINGIRM